MHTKAWDNDEMDPFKSSHLPMFTLYKGYKFLKWNHSVTLAHKREHIAIVAIATLLTATISPRQMSAGSWRSHNGYVMQA